MWWFRHGVCFISTVVACRTAYSFLILRSSQTSVCSFGRSINSLEWRSSPRGNKDRRSKQRGTGSGAEGAVFRTGSPCTAVGGIKFSCCGCMIWSVWLLWSHTWQTQEAEQTEVDYSPPSHTESSLAPSPLHTHTFFNYHLDLRLPQIVIQLIQHMPTPKSNTYFNFKNKKGNFFNVFIW